jgi:hypothetical protein
MLKTTLNAAVLAAVSALALAPTFAHASVLTLTTDKVAFDVSNSISDTLGGKTTGSNGSTSSTANTNMDTESKAAVARFDKSKGVLTGATVNLTSTYKQTTNVTVANGSGVTGANTDGTFTTKGTGSSSISLGIPTGVVGASASLSAEDT